MGFLIKLIISALAVFAASYLLPGVDVESFTTAIIVALVLAVLNLLLKPLLIILTIPITILTLGLFLLVINALMVIWADSLIDGFEVDGWWAAILFSLIVSVVSAILNGLATKRD